MDVYAISDLHLSSAQPKPMDIFGPAWKDHPEKLRQNWDRLVRPSDIVLIPGDVSWAMRLPEAMPDLKFIAERPGRKVITRGNHDYWWNRKATSRIQQTVNRGLVFLQGTSVALDGVGITGTRGWRLDDEGRGRAANPYATSTSEEDGSQSEKIFRRELAYLENGLRSIPDSVELKIAMLHYPPFDEQLRPNEFAHVLSRYSVDILVYGHVHLGLGNWVDGEIEGVKCRLVSADIVDFTPQKIVEVG